MIGVEDKVRVHVADRTGLKGIVVYFQDAEAQLAKNPMRKETSWSGRDVAK
jgi:hypothetical protein